ncbi:MAG: [FeFe] hydrogenase H-cluster radical SAM maturase HydE [Thermodesulfovibrio sp.]
MSERKYSFTESRSKNGSELKEYILHLLKEVSFEEVASTANKIREETKGNIVHLRALIEFSNYCRCNCLFCGIRRDNKKLPRYRMTEKEIINIAYEAAKSGYKTIVLQSGEDPFWDAKTLSRAIREIKKMNLAVTLSIGERSYDDYAKFREAGADRYLLKFETSDERLFMKLKPDTTLRKRIQCIRWLKKLGYETGSGIIVGLPGQSLESISEDIYLFKELDLDMIGVGPLIPHPDTPLANFGVGNPIITLKIIAITRIILPYANIPATTALGTLSSDLRLKALNAGANVVMPDVTSEKYKKLYEIYPGKSLSKGSFEYWREILSSINRTIGQDYGSVSREYSTKVINGRKFTNAL